METCKTCNKSIENGSILCNECIAKQYEDVSMGLNSDDLEFGAGTTCTEEQYTIQALQRENDSLKEELRNIANKNTLNANALKMLIGICKEGGFDPFPNEDFPFKRPISALSKEELLEKNSKITKKYISAKSSDKISRKDGFDYQLKIVENHKDNPIISLVVDAKNNGGIITLDQYQNIKKENGDKGSSIIDDLINHTYVINMLHELSKEHGVTKENLQGNIEAISALDAKECQLIESLKKSEK